MATKRWMFTAALALVVIAVGCKGSGSDAPAAASAPSVASAVPTPSASAVTVPTRIIDTKPRPVSGALPEPKITLSGVDGAKYAYVQEDGEESESVVEIAADGKRRVLSKRRSIWGLVADGESVFWMETPNKIGPYETITCFVKRYSPGKPTQQLAVRKDAEFVTALTLDRFCWVEIFKVDDFDDDPRLTCVPRSGGRVTQATEQLDKRSSLVGFGRYVFVLPDEDEHMLRRYLVPGEVDQPPRPAGQVSLPEESNYSNLAVDGSGVYWIDGLQDTINWVGHEAFDGKPSARPIALARVPDRWGSLNPRTSAGAGRLAVVEGSLRWAQQDGAKELPKEAVEVLIARGGAAPRDEVVNPVRATDIDEICQAQIRYGYTFPGATTAAVLRKYPTCLEMGYGKFCCIKEKMGQ